MSSSLQEMAEAIRDSPPSATNRPEQDPWESAFLVNRTQSKLIATLPEELLVHIMSFLTRADLWELRHASRIFMRLFHGPQFNDIRTNGFSKRDLWARPDLENDMWEYDRKLRSLETRHLKALFCESCLQFSRHMTKETDNSFLQERLEATACGVCGTFHVKACFSPAEREKPTGDRKCIGNEGVLRVCAHVSLSWEGIEGKNGPDSSHTECSHPSHKTTTMTSPGSASQNSQKPSTIENPPQLITRTPPTLDLQLSLSDPESFPITTINTKWSIEVFDIPSGQSVTFTELEAELGKLSRQTTCYLCPHMSFDDRQLLLPFDPNRCACLGSNLPIRHPHPQNQLWWPPSHSSDQAEDDKIKNTKSPEPSETCCVCISAKSPSSSGTFLPEPTNACHTIACEFCTLACRWTRDGSRIILTAISTLEVDRPTQYEWLIRLAPESFGVVDDELAHRLSWCDDGACTTSYRWRRQAGDIALFCQEAQKRRPDWLDIGMDVRY